MDILIKSSVSIFKIKSHLRRLSFLPSLLLPLKLRAQTWHCSVPHCLGHWQEPMEKEETCHPIKL